MAPLGRSSSQVPRTAPSTALIASLPSQVSRNPLGSFLLLLLAAIWLTPRSALPSLASHVQHHYPHAFPRPHFDLHPSTTGSQRFSANKTALTIHPNPYTTHSTPQLLHIATILPPDWRLIFLGASDIVQDMRSNDRVADMVSSGKLSVLEVETWTDTWLRKDIADVHSEPEIRNRLLTDVAFYDEVLPGVEWLLYFDERAMLCANANGSVEDFMLHYDWVGAPLTQDERWGGLGTPSLRRLPRLREALVAQTRQHDFNQQEDGWMVGRLAALPDPKPTPGEVSRTFVVERVWYDKPLGYHVPHDMGPGAHMEVWGNDERRKRIFGYCPELKIVTPMRLESERCKDGD